MVGTCAERDEYIAVYQRVILSSIAAVFVSIAVSGLVNLISRSALKPGTQLARLTSGLGGTKLGWVSPIS